MPSQVTTIDELKETSHMKINQNYNNDYLETDHLYATMLQYDVGFTTESKPNDNIATSAYD